MPHLIMEPNGHVLVLANGIDAFEDEVTQVDIPIYVGEGDQEKRIDHDEAMLDGMGALAAGLGLLVGFWTLFH